MKSQDGDKRNSNIYPGWSHYNHRVCALPESSIKPTVQRRAGRAPRDRKSNAAVTYSIGDRVSRRQCDTLPKEIWTVPMDPKRAGMLSIVAALLTPS
jgi:hypothetical protein